MSGNRNTPRRLRFARELRSSRSVNFLVVFTATKRRGAWRPTHAHATHARAHVWPGCAYCAIPTRVLCVCVPQKGMVYWSLVGETILRPRALVIAKTIGPYQFISSRNERECVSSLFFSNFRRWGEQAERLFASSFSFLDRTIDEYGKIFFFFFFLVDGMCIIFMCISAIEWLFVSFQERKIRFGKVRILLFFSSILVDRWNMCAYYNCMIEIVTIIRIFRKIKFGE